MDKRQQHADVCVRKLNNAGRRTARINNPAVYTSYVRARNIRGGKRKCVRVRAFSIRLYTHIYSTYIAHTSHTLSTSRTVDDGEVLSLFLRFFLRFSDPGPRTHLFAVVTTDCSRAAIYLKIAPLCALHETRGLCLRLCMGETHPNTFDANKHK